MRFQEAKKKHIIYVKNILKWVERFLKGRKE